MKLAWLTDIHLNFLSEEGRKAFYAEIKKSSPDAVVISGDISEFTSLIEIFGEMDCAWRIPVYFVLGNHDFYRGSFKQGERNAEAVCREMPRLCFLDRAEVVQLTAQVALLGHSSWYDARFGDAAQSTVTMRDFSLIKEFSSLPRPELLVAIRERAQLAAEHFRTYLPQALESSEQVVLVTHVPPFAEAAAYMGQQGDSEYLPFYSCKVVGDLLREIMVQYKHRSLLVLCGHTHTAVDMLVAPNIRVMVGEAEYSNPSLQSVIDLGRPLLKA